MKNQTTSKKLYKGFRVRILLKNEELDLLENFCLKIKDLANWKVRARQTTRVGYDWEFFLTLNRSKNETRTIL